MNVLKKQENRKNKRFKNNKVNIILPILIIIYVYALIIEKIPNEYIMFEGESVNVNSSFGIKINDENLETSNKLTVSLFNNIPIKEIEVSVVPKSQVIPVGDLIGLKLYTNGVLVVGMSEIEGIDNKKYKPYQESGIVEGDCIIEVNNNAVENIEELSTEVAKSNGEAINIKYIQNQEIKVCSMEPVRTVSGQYKLGLWVRDSAAGVGTISYYEPESKIFGTLGHGITDIDTEQLIDISEGEFVTTKILNLIKGETNNPGKIQGNIEGGQNVGTVIKNTQYGLFGIANDLSMIDIDASNKMDVALREEIEIGKATILCDVDDEGVKEYDIEIEKIYLDNMYNNKSMQIEVVDPDLIEKTGGIIQGMSGSPIIQNGKFVGAITYVLVNNAKKGYAVFGDMMIKESK